MNKQLLSMLALMLALAAPGAGLEPLAAQNPVISTVEEIKADALSVPCKNSERKAAVIALLEKMGAAASDVAVQKIGDVENIVLNVPGTGTGKIVVGAHYDKVENGCEWRKVLHTSNDQVAKVYPESVYLGYRLALAMIWTLDSEPCDVSR